MGQIVNAQYQGQWYPARIDEVVGDHKYNITWLTDNTNTQGYQENHRLYDSGIRKAKSTWKVSDFVEVKSSTGRWEQARIIEVFRVYNYKIKILKGFTFYDEKPKVIDYNELHPPEDYTHIRIFRWVPVGHSAWETVYTKWYMEY